jgi:folate-binding protein YgfZ
MPGIIDQYRIIADGAGVVDKSLHGRLQFRGAGAAAFLQALVSNEVSALARGQGVYATYLTPQGRLIADLRLYHRGDSLLADVAPGTAGALAARFDQLIFAEDVQPADVTAGTFQLGVAGGHAAAVLARAFGADAAALAALPLWSQIDAGDVVIARTDDGPLPSFDVFGAAAGRDAAEGALAAAGATPMPPGLVASLRVDAGRPLFGVDMTEETIPLEAGLLDRAISTSKGCYVGQEVIIRVLHRGGGRVARRLAKLTFDRTVTAAPAAGDHLADEGRDVGRLTSVARALDDTAWIALGYVHRDSAVPGRALTLVDRPDARATIASLAG